MSCPPPTIAATKQKFANRGVGLGNGGYKLPRPTRARPGTPGKLRILAARAAAGLALWHPRDAV